jgi:peptidoglycan/xylan/chitin deacetylase (PgdA/CDA1 family)
MYILSVLISCTHKKTNYQGATAITFDDHSINEWYAQRFLFKKYDVHATFYISDIEKLSSKEINQLKTLQMDGHQIGIHGFHHLRIPKRGLNTYIKNEILPAIQILEENEFLTPTSFAPPFGRSNPSFDKKLKDYCTIIREARWNDKHKNLSEYDDIYIKDTQQFKVSSIGIDENYDLDFEEIIEGIDRLQFKKEVLVLHAHKINTSGASYSINPKLLRKLFNYCRYNKVEFLTMNETRNFMTKN